MDIILEKKNEKNKLVEDEKIFQNFLSKELFKSDRRSRSTLRSGPRKVSEFYLQAILRQLCEGRRGGSPQIAPLSAPMKSGQDFHHSLEQCPPGGCDTRVDGPLWRGR